eukprot:18727-Heterococcus_DN1.PRE.3
MHGWRSDQKVCSVESRVRVAAAAVLPAALSINTGSLKNALSATNQYYHTALPTAATAMLKQ